MKLGTDLVKKDGNRGEKVGDKTGGMHAINKQAQSNRWEREQCLESKLSYANMRKHGVLNG